MEAQVENAIQLAGNPSTDPTLRSQALDFVNRLRSDPSCWQVCLSLFTRSPRPEEIVRHVCLEVVNVAVQTQQLDAQSLGFIKDSLMEYVRQNYAGTADVDSSGIQNKITQTLTYLFAYLYPSTWQTFFDDFRALAGDATSIGTVNAPATKLYLRILGSVHDEIADVLVARSEEEHRRNTELKDMVRARDAQKIAASWQEILAKWQQTDLGIVDMCLKTVARWVNWTDISLVVNDAMLSNLLQMAGQQGISESNTPESRVRDSAIDTFTETVSKKMKPAEKIELILFLNLGNVVGQLIASPALAELRSTHNYDTDLAETVAKLVNATSLDIVKVLDTDGVDDQTRERAEGLAQVFVPYLLRFFSDEYDEICSTVIPSLTDLLTFFRKLAKSQGALPPYYASTLSPILDAIINKMKYDETASWGDMDEQTDEAEFQELRKRLHNLQQTIAAIDEQLYIDTISQVVGSIFTKLGTNDQGFNWRDLDLALHEMFLFGELAVKNQGLYTKRGPISPAASRQIEMMQKMVESDVAAYPHPAIQLQYMEICVRYCQFFEQNTALTPRVLENFVRLTHHEHIRVRTRSWYLFLRFARPLRQQVGNVSQTVIQALGDLLVIQAQLPDDNDDDMSSDEDEDSADAVFNSQLNLFEAIGCISSASSVPPENKVLYAQSVMSPMFSDLENNLAAAKGGDERAILQIHHIIQALGTLARGFSDWQPTSKSGAPPTSEVTEDFAKAAEAILVALESLNDSQEIRTAARFAFSRLIGVLGTRLLEQLPRWIEGLLSQSSTRDEMAMFLRLLDQVIHAMQSEISGILDTLVTPLLQRVFTALGEAPNGTDDEIQLAELRREYLNFILIILNHELAHVLVSSANQPLFETILQTCELFARDTSDYANARLAITVLIRIIDVWGGPNLPPPYFDQTQTAPALPGFDSFAITRFSPLTWAVVTAQGFNGKDAMARQVIGEVAGLQAELLRKFGGAYGGVLKVELEELGLQEGGREEFFGRMGAGVGKDERAWRNWFAGFVGGR